MRLELKHETTSVMDLYTYLFQLVSLALSLSLSCVHTLLSHPIRKGNQPMFGSISARPGCNKQFDRLSFPSLAVKPSSRSIIGMTRNGTLSSLTQPNKTRCRIWQIGWLSILLMDLCLIYGPFVGHNDCSDGDPGQVMRRHDKLHQPVQDTCRA